MSYTITNTRNSTVALVNDNTLNSQTDLQLIGRSYTNFGIAFNKNLVKLMENFANPTAPANPLEGELWWNTASKTLSVYNGSAWANIVPIADTITATNFNATYGNIVNQNAGTVNATNLYGSVIGNTGAALSGATLSLTGTSTLNTINAVSVNAGTIGNTSAVIQGATIQSLGGGQIAGYLSGAIGANVANTGAFTTITASSVTTTSVTTTSGGQLTGYHTGPIGANAANTGAFTTVIVSGALNAASMSTTGGGQLTGYLTGAIGANTANTGAFTTVNATGAVTAASFTTTGGGQLTGYHTGAIGANTPNTVVATSVTTTGGGQLTGYFTGAIGANTPNTVVATSVTTTNGGQLTGYLTGAIGANTPNTVVATSVTTTNGGQLTGYLTGAIGANTANTAAFTSVGITANVTIANTPVIASANGEIQSGRLTGRYSSSIGNPSVYYYNDYNNDGNVTTADATSASRLENNLTPVVTGEFIQPAFGSSYGVKKVGIGFHQGTASDVQRAVVGSSTLYSGNVNAVVLGYMNNGPRILMMDRSLIDETANVAAYTANVHRFYNNSINSMTIDANANVNINTYLTVNSGIYWANGVSYSSGGGGSTFTTATVTGLLTLNSSNGVTAIANGGTNGVGNIGASGATFNTIFAKATTAQYADVAEKYLADAEYPAGTVVVFGGEKEITISSIDHDHTVAGVISTDPAYLMNSESNGLAVALLGRVPCLVKGPINVGDRVVTSYINGTAMRLDISRYQPGCIMGKSLGTIEDDSIQTIEVVVGRN